MSNRENEKILTSRFCCLFVSVFFSGMVMYMLMTTIAEFTSTFSSSGTVAGLASGMYIIGALLARLYSGQALTKHGWKKMLVIGLALHTVTCLGYFIIRSAWMLILVRFLHGIGFGICTNALLVIGYSTFPKTRYSEAAGYFMLGPTLATGFGPYIGGFVYDIFGSTGCFAATLICCVISWIFGGILNLKDVDPGVRKVEEKAADSEDETADAAAKVAHKEEGTTNSAGKAADAAAKKTERKRWSLSSVIQPSAVPICFCVFLFTIGYASVVSFYRPYATECGLEKQFSFLLLIYSVVLIFIRMKAGKVQDKKGDNLLCYSGLVFQVIGLFSIAWAPSMVSVLICAFGCAFGYGSTSACCNVIINRNLPVNQRALGVTTFYIFCDCAMGFGPMLMGTVQSIGGYSFMYYMTAVLTVVSIVVYYWVWGRKSH